MSKMAGKKTPTLSDKATEHHLVNVRLKPYPYDSGDITLMDRTLLRNTWDKKASDFNKKG